MCYENIASRKNFREDGFCTPPPFGERKLMISGRFRVSAGAMKKCFALAAFSAALALPAFGDPSETLYYDGGVNHPTLYQYEYNWGHNIYEDQWWGSGEMHFGTESPQNDGTARVIFTKEHEGTVVIYRDVNPYDVIVESGNYVFEPLGWNDAIASTSKDGTIAGSGSLTVNAGASLTMYIDNSYTGDTIVAGTLSTDVHSDAEDSDYGSGHHAFGTGALRVESTGTVNLNGTVQGNSTVEIAGTLNLGENKSGAEAAYNPFVASGADLKLDGATLSQTVSDLKLSGGSSVSLENGASLSVNGLSVEISSADAAAITLSGNSALTLGGSLQLNIADALLAELLENQGTATVQVVSVADAGDSGAADCIEGKFASVQVNDGSRWTATFDPTTGGVLISAVPEPAFIGLLFGAFGLLHATRRRPRSRRLAAA